MPVNCSLKMIDWALCKFNLNKLHATLKKSSGKWKSVFKKLLPREPILKRKNVIFPKEAIDVHWEQAEVEAEDRVFFGKVRINVYSRAATKAAVLLSGSI